MSSTLLTKVYTEGDFTISNKYLAKKKKVIEQSITEAKTYDIDILKFKKFVSNILQKFGKLSSKSVDKYTSADNLRELMTACTHWSFDFDNNYEFYEILGDSTLNNVIVWYYVRIFPELQKMSKERSTYILAKLKIKGIQKVQFAQFCDDLGLSEYIRYRELHYVELPKKVEKQINKDISMKEDVFEAFFGSLNSIINTEEDGQLGFIVVNQIITEFLDSIGMGKNLTLEPRQLEEGISMLKEIFDVLSLINPNNKTEFKVIEQGDPSKGKYNVYELKLKLYLKSNNFQLLEKTFEEEGIRKSKGDVEESLSHKALEWLEKKYSMRWDYKNIYVPADA